MIMGESGPVFRSLTETTCDFLYPEKDCYCRLSCRQTQGKQSSDSSAFACDTW